MKKILTAQQMRNLDSYTIGNGAITSLDLMEKASQAVARRIADLFPSSKRIIVFAGPGNNGGDALAVARLLSQQGFPLSVYLFNIGNKLSQDCQTNKTRLKIGRNLEFHEVITDFVPPQINPGDIVVDGLFGTGLSRPLMGGFAAVVKYINASEATIVSIDVPSGLMTEDNSANIANHIVKANYTFTFQNPKLAFLFADNEQYVGKLEILDIGLIDPKDGSSDTPYYIIEEHDIREMIRPRPRFSHKGTFGHALLIAGKRGMAGAAILASKACMRSGAGKLTVHTPEANTLPLQITIPEVILEIEPSTDRFTLPVEATKYDAVAIGPGIGTDESTVRAVIAQMTYSHDAFVIDADAINIIANNKERIHTLPAEAILTPHKKELRGLIGQSGNCFEELQMTRKYAQLHRVFVVMKGANTAIVTPEGDVFFNPTGNAGMATAGSGDVLTGIILSLLAQDYPHLEAAILATYLHGLAGDIAADNLSQESMIASDIVDSLPYAFKKMKE